MGIKKSGGDDAVTIVDLPDGGVITSFRADKQLRIGRRFELAGKKLLQNRWSEFASAASAVGQTGQAEGGCGRHGAFSP